MPRNAPLLDLIGYGRPSIGPEALVARACVQEVRFGGLSRPSWAHSPQENGRESVMDHPHVALFEFEWMS